MLTQLGGNSLSIAEETASRNKEIPRARHSLDEGWRFHLGDVIRGEAPNFDDRSWMEIDIPHDWSIAGPFAKENPSSHMGGYLPGGIGWYRKVITAPYDSDHSVRVEFDGVYMNSDVWINGHHLGLRPYGYSSFEYDLTSYLHTDGSPNILAVRVDNSAQPSSRWYSGSGIYRHVWLNVTSPIHIDHWGTCVTTASIDSNRAVINIAVQLRNARGARGKAVITNSILSVEGSELARAEKEMELVGATVSSEQELRVNNPKLWSADEPNLYIARTTVLHAGKVVDTYDTVFGIRTFTFDANNGFSINGRPTKLQGVCMHHDLGALGAAFSEAATKRRLKLLKEMGCNAIRLAHNPPAPQLLDMCDEMGFYVVDEAFDEWEKGKSLITFGYHLYFKDWAERDLRDMILRDRNHPSIILWSIGNEIPDKAQPSGVETCARLARLVHAIDPTRPVTAAINSIESANKSGYAQILDVVGYNGGGNSAFFYDADHAKYPERKMYGSEVPHTQQTRGVYNSDPNYCTSYAQGFVELTSEDSWRLTRERKFLAGEFRWAGIDYLGEPTRHLAFHLPARPEDASWPARSSEAGVIDMCGFPKDIYFFYQSQWTRKPMLHLLPHWNWAGAEGQTIRVWCYSNCDLVELFLNDRSLGKKYIFANGPMHLEWEVNYVPGKIRATGWKKGVEVCQEEIKTAGAPARVLLIAERPELEANGKDLVYVRAVVTDAEGTMVPDANHRIRFEVSGPVKLIAVDNGDTNSHESFQGESIPAFHGMCIAILHSLSTPGAITITATAPELQGGSAQVRARESNSQPKQRNL